eukprot:6204145-Pleurochrysis_carterae.AAC.8
MVQRRSGRRATPTVAVLPTPAWQPSGLVARRPWTTNAGSGGGGRTPRTRTVSRHICLSLTSLLDISAARCLPGKPVSGA